MKYEDTVMSFERMQEIDLKNAESNFTDALRDVAREQAEITWDIAFKAGRDDKDKEWDDWRVKYIPNAIAQARQEGRQEYHAFMETPCPHFVADRYFTESPCKDCYEAKLKGWGLDNG